MIFKQALTFVSWSARVAWVLLVALACVAKSQDFSQVPGVVIDDSPKSTNSYIGSPSIAILPNGDYIASHDYFGPGSTETTSGVEKVFISHDKGATWSLQSTINGNFGRVCLFTTTTCTSSVCKAMPEPWSFANLPITASPGRRLRR